MKDPPNHPVPARAMPQPPQHHRGGSVGVGGGGRKGDKKAARKAKTASLAITPPDDGQYPRTPQGTLPFDGADLNQPFDAGFVDDVAQSRNLPPLPSRIRFGG
ncbi:MAG: hypothetical protein AAFU86_09375 [Pseudomonadota bacterium]